MASFKEVDKIGSGGFGEVWTCRRKTDGSVFAKKKLQHAMDSQGVERFIREVQILSFLNHPNIIRVVDKHLHAEPYSYIMPLYKHSLSSQIPTLIRNDARIFKIYTAVLSAMEYAHAQGIIHRDLKPENILMNTDTEVVVSDFGLGRIIDADTIRITQTGLGLGTRLYMAPEQQKNAKEADTRADIFSLGRILYELYSGQISSSVQDTSILPDGVALLVTRCTKNDPKLRYQYVSDLKRDWLSLFDAAQRETETEELTYLATELSTPESIDQEKAKRVLTLLVKCQEDGDLIHKIIMQIHPKVLADLHRSEPVSVKTIIEHFIDLIMSHGWPFEYTDKIGNRCRDIYHAIDDVEIRAVLIRCLLDVGIGHRRWHVQGIFAQLIQAIKEPAAEIALIARLEQVQPYTRAQFVEYLDVNALTPGLRKFFEEARDRFSDELNIEELPF